MSAKKTFNILIISIVFILATAPSADAWSWKTHADVVEMVYYGLPAEVQKNLNLEIMKNGSNEPDEVFKDFTTHSYPKSYQKAQTWLDKGKLAYDRGDYDEASYDYGVASHYISDTFSAPHGVSKEDSNDHSKYEDLAKDLKPATVNITGDLETMLKNGYTDGGNSWKEWIQNKENKDIIQKDLNYGASAALAAINNSINSELTNNLFTSLTELLGIA
jgi:hypothetical protein